MEQWLIWIIIGLVLMTLEILVPGMITIFIGLAAFIVGSGIKFGYLKTYDSIILTFITSTLFFLIIIRTLFLKFFKGDETIHNVDENLDAQGTIVLVEEDILPHKQGRVKFRGTSWQARSDNTILKDSKAIIINFDGNILIVKSIEE
jgi:membrane protein implicated in regulation of membrane protease activity